MAQADLRGALPPEWQELALSLSLEAVDTSPGCSAGGAGGEVQSAQLPRRQQQQQQPPAPLVPERCVEPPQLQQAPAPFEPQQQRQGEEERCAVQARYDEQWVEQQRYGQQQPQHDPEQPEQQGHRTQQLYGGQQYQQDPRNEQQRCGEQPCQAELHFEQQGWMAEQEQQGDDGGPLSCQHLLLLPQHYQQQLWLQDGLEGSEEDAERQQPRRVVVVEGEERGAAVRGRRHPQRQLQQQVRRKGKGQPGVQGRHALPAEPLPSGVSSGEGQRRVWLADETSCEGLGEAAAGQPQERRKRKNWPTVRTRRPRKAAVARQQPGRQEERPKEDTGDEPMPTAGAPSSQEGPVKQEQQQQQQQQAPSPEQQQQAQQSGVVGPAPHSVHHTVDAGGSSPLQATPGAAGSSVELASQAAQVAQPPAACPGLPGRGSPSQDAVAAAAGVTTQQALGLLAAAGLAGEGQRPREQMQALMQALRLLGVGASLRADFSDFFIHSLTPAQQAQHVVVLAEMTQEGGAAEAARWVRRQAGRSASEPKVG